MSMTPLEELRHSASHVLATAVLRLFPDAKLDIGPPTDAGFYYDIDLDHKLTAEDLTKLEVEMKKIADENQRFDRKEVSREEAVEIIKSRGQERYKARPSRRHSRGRKDLVLHQRRVRRPLRRHAHPLHGQAEGLQAPLHRRRLSPRRRDQQAAPAPLRHRVPDQGGTRRHLVQLEEAKLRDHRKLGRELKLFHIDEDVGQGLILWTPNGAILRQELQNFISEELRKQGYSQVFTPHIGKPLALQDQRPLPLLQGQPVRRRSIENDDLAKLIKEGCGCCRDVMDRLDAVSTKLAEPAQRARRQGSRSPRTA
jgi:threonyl-tRNA synthetase